MLRASRQIIVWQLVCKRNLLNYVKFPPPASQNAIHTHTYCRKRLYFRNDLYMLENNNILLCNLIETNKARYLFKCFSERFTSNSKLIWLISFHFFLIDLNGFCKRCIWGQILWHRFSSQGNEYIIACFHRPNNELIFLQSQWWLTVTY